MIKTVTMAINNRDFEIYVSPPQYAATMVEITIWEVVRPTWKILRCRYFGSRTIWLADIQEQKIDLREGIRRAIVSELRKQEEIEERYAEFDRLQ
jgi:hypothetical protein